MGLLENTCFMHEGQGWGLLAGGWVCIHTQLPDQRTPWLLGRDAQESSYRQWSSFFNSFVPQHSRAVLFLFPCPQCSQYTWTVQTTVSVHVCLYLTVIWDWIPRQQASLITSVTLSCLFSVLFSEGFLAVSLLTQLIILFFLGISSFFIALGVGEWSQGEGYCVMWIYICVCVYVCVVGGATFACIKSAIHIKYDTPNLCAVTVPSGHSFDATLCQHLPQAASYSNSTAWQKVLLIAFVSTQSRNDVWTHANFLKGQYSVLWNKQ